MINVCWFTRTCVYTHESNISTKDRHRIEKKYQQTE